MRSAARDESFSFSSYLCLDFGNLISKVRVSREEEVEARGGGWWRHK